MISLFSHNETAYEAAETMLAETGKAAIIHPTGTGKSFIGFKLCETHADAVVCWLSPSSYIFETQIENLKKVTGGYAPENIVFFTYAKLMLMEQSELDEIRADYIILDEFHRAGAEMWQVGVENLLKTYPDAPILGLSATHIRYLDNQRDMADELFDGNVASEITLGEAIVRGILQPPKYVLSVFSYQKDLEKYQRKVRQAKNRAVRDAAEQYLDALRRALAKADGLDEIFAKHMTEVHGKYIVFCANAEHMQEMIAKVPEWFAKVDKKPNIYSAYSDDPSTSQAFADFKTDSSEHLKLLFCIDMLNEGVHVDDIDGVILLRPTVSPIIYKQQIGRALAAGKNGTPLIFDIVNNFENLYSISAIEQEMQAAITYYRDLGEGEEIVNERFRILDEVRDAKKLFDALNDTLEASWDMMFSYAKEYFEQYGNLNVPKRYKTVDGYSLGTWIMTQRRIRQGAVAGHLSEERIRKLDSIGMIWQSQVDFNWERNFNALKQYHEKYGDIDIKTDYVTEDGIALGTWIANIRTWKCGNVKSNYLTPERIEALEALGIIWSKHDYLFERNYAAAMEYHRQYGNLDIPYDYVCPTTHLRLGIWIQNLRTKNNRKPDSIPPEQKQRLEAIGMEWESKYDRQWNEGLREAQKYHKMHGNLDIPSKYVTPGGYRLGDWLTNNRMVYKANKLKSSRVQQLEALGVIWNKSRANSWETCYEHVRDYSNEHGDINIPPDYTADGIWLNKWLNEQKHIYHGKRKGKSLTDEQIRLLEEIGMTWKTRNENAWEQRYAEAKAFYDRNGHLNLPLPEYKKLNTWLIVQRKAYSQGKLTDEQITKLNEVGMVWAFEDPWEIGFEHAEAYYKEHRNLHPVPSYVCADGYKLGSWIANQRSVYTGTQRYGRLTAEQIKRLEAIGMDWNPNATKWMESYRLAEEFYRQHGHTEVPKDYECSGGADLYTWIQEQKKAYRKGKLSDDRKVLLDKLDFEWRTAQECAWDKHYESAVQYSRASGSLDIAAAYRDDSGFQLGQWLRSQRMNKDKLSRSQVQRLTEIGMEW